jgi:hypothetical protein
VRTYIIAWPSRPAQPSTYLGKYKDLPRYEFPRIV